MNTIPNAYEVHIYRQPSGTLAGGYPDNDGNLHTIPTQADATYYMGDGGTTQTIVNWAKGVADAYWPEWAIDGVDIKNSDDQGDRNTLRVFAPGSDAPLDLTPYESYLDTEEDEDDEDPDFILVEDGEDAEDYARLDVLTPIQQIINAAAQGLFDNIVADVPQDEADLRQRFEAFGLLG